MKNKFFILLIAGLIMTSCNDDTSLYAPMTDDAVSVEQSLGLDGINPHLNGMEITRPMKVKGNGIIEYDNNGCGEGEFLVEVFGEGTATHFGKFDLYLSYCRSMMTGEPVGPPTGYQIAANGDILTTVLASDGEDDGRYFQVYALTGGTGRFEEASGWVKLYFSFDNPMFPTSYSNYGEGEITF